MRAESRRFFWDNPETYIDNEDGSYNTERRLNFDYEYGILVTKEFTEENFWFRPWWRPYALPDYTLYRKGWEIGDGVHIATGNYTKILHRFKYCVTGRKV